MSNSPSDIATTCLGEEKLQSEVSDMFSGYFASCCLSEVYGNSTSKVVSMGPEYGPLARLGRFLTEKPRVLTLPQTNTEPRVAPLESKVISVDPILGFRLTFEEAESLCM